MSDRQGGARQAAAPRAGLVRADARIMRIDPKTVLVPERIGFLHEDKAVALGRLIAVDGQRDPIKVVSIESKGGKSWRLVVGMHRLQGCLIEGIDVLAMEVFGKAEDLIDLEASENKHRRTLNPIEDAKFIAALVQAAQERVARERGDLKQQQYAIKARWERVKAGHQRAEEALRDEVKDTESQFATAYGVGGSSWESTVGNALGMGRDAIYRAMRIYRFIAQPFPDLAEALSKHPVVGENASQLRAIADIKDEATRREVIEALLADKELSADEARVLCGIDRPESEARDNPEQVLLNRAIGTLARMKDREREAFVEHQVFQQKVAVKRRIFERLRQDLGQ